MVLIVSGGRTGTTFLGDLLDRVVDDAFSVHEPDVWDGVSWKTWRRIRQFGLYHMTLGRIIGKTGIRNLSRRFLSGRLSLTELTHCIRRHREAYYRSVDADLIIESNYQWYGILPGVPRVFPRYRIVSVVRDPRPWVESYRAQQRRRGSGDRVERWGLRRLSPEMVGDRTFARRWPEMSTFERLCWDWKHIYGCLEEQVAEDPRARFFRFEDLFLSNDRTETFREMLDFLTTFSDRSFDYEFDHGLLDIRKNRSRKATPAEVAEEWQRWPAERACKLDAVCGPVMQRLGYGHEPRWREMVEKD